VGASGSPAAVQPPSAASCCRPFCVVPGRWSAGVPAAPGGAAGCSPARAGGGRAGQGAAPRLVVPRRVLFFLSILSSSGP